jgi:hypothetical protein
MINYFMIIGRLTDNKVLKIRHSYLIQNKKIKKNDIKSDLNACCLDIKGKVLNSVPILTCPYCLPNDSSNDLAISEFIPVPNKTKSISFYFKGELILNLPIPEKSPEFTLDWNSILREIRDTGKTTIFWHLSDGSVDSYPSYCDYSIDNGKSWRRFPFVEADKNYKVDVNNLPGGKKCKLAFLVTDGFNVSRSESPPFPVRIKPCVSMILNPKDGATFSKGDIIEFVGQGYYMEEQKPELKEIRWKSSIGGSLGLGQILQVRNLNIGEHIITLVTGTGRRIGKEEIKISVIE